MANLACAASSQSYRDGDSRRWYGRNGPTTMNAAVNDARPPTTLITDPAVVAEFWDALVAPGDVHEVRIPKSRRGPARLFGTISGYFDNCDAFVSALTPLTGEDAEGIYLTLNPVDPDLLARASNRLVSAASHTTTDADVLRLRHVLIDIDSQRKRGISATDEELAAAIAVRDTVKVFLQDEVGWPNPVAITRSGNGGGLLYRLDLPNEPIYVDELRRILVALQALFGTNAVSIDTTTFNASRMTKVLGTIAAKGENVPSRPWRQATGSFPPGFVIPVEHHLLETLAALSASRSRSSNSSYDDLGSHRHWDIRDRLRDAGISFTEADKGYGTVYRLDRCLTSTDHTDGACLIEFPSGALTYRCHHDRCAGKGWSDVRNLLIPPNASHDPRMANSPCGDEDTGRWGDDTGERPIPKRDLTLPVLDPAALHGLAGEVVRVIDPHTEADPVALLMTFLEMFGSAIGRSPHVRVGAASHHANEYAVLVGNTSHGRKGTAQQEVQRLFELADPEWVQRIAGGLSSGEGLIYAVRDATNKIDKDGNEVLADAGVEDKRLLAVEPEFASVLRKAGLDGNTVSENLRRGWDGDNLRTLTKHSPLAATHPHISVLGHITKTELLKELSETSKANGWANRHLFVMVRRSKELPHGGALAQSEVDALAFDLQQAIARARVRGELRRDEEANRMWEAVYHDLTSDRPGMFGAVTARAEAHVLRLSLLYALLDDGPAIQRPHLEAALAVWQYCEDSARFIFGDATGDINADRILDALRTKGRMPQNEIIDLFGRNLPGPKLSRSLDELVRLNLVRSTRVPSGGRPTTMWEAV